MSNTVFKTLNKMITKLGIKTIKRIPKNSVILTHRVENYLVKDNDKFKLSQNKSYPRDVNCSDCNHQVVMSNWTYDQYSKMKVKVRVICFHCLPDIVDKEGEAKSVVTSPNSEMKKDWETFIKKTDKYDA